ncbi:MAG: hypothetical protein ACR2QG_11170 [Gammaproteobacteria bacterium]
MKKLITLGLLLAAASANAVTYNLHLLNNQGGESTAYAMNDNGMVVGQSYNSTTSQMESTVWNSKTASAQSLGVTGIARGINNSGVVVGETGSASLIIPNGYAYSWTSSGGITNLGTLGGNYSGAYDINESGAITGFAWPTGAAFSTFGQGFIYKNGVMTPLGTVSSPTGYSRGHGINNSDEIVGRGSVVNFNDSDKYAIYWDENQNLDQFDIPESGTYSTTEQINNNGLIVGASRTPTTGNTLHAVSWDTDGNINFLNNPNGSSFGSKMWSVNDAGIMVGYDQVISGNIVTDATTTRAIISYDGVNIIDLNSIVDLTGTGMVALSEAYDVNANGDIVGTAYDAAGNRHAVYLAAVPIPAAVWLFASGLGLLGWLRRRQTAL